MNHEIIDETNLGRFIIKRYGYLTYERSSIMLKDLLSHKNWRKGMSFLMDFRQASLEEFSIEQLKNLGILLSSLNNIIGDGRCAIVALPDQLGKVAMHNFNSESKLGLT